MSKRARVAVMVGFAAALWMIFFLWQENRDMTERYQIHLKTELHEALIQLNRALDAVGQTVSTYPDIDTRNNIEQLLFERLLQENLKDLEKSGYNAFTTLSKLDPQHQYPLNINVETLAYRTSDNIQQIFSAGQVSDGTAGQLAQTIENYADELSDLVWQDGTESVLAAQNQQQIVNTLNQLDQELTELLNSR
ncbi:MAG: hypothetical protein H0Z33_00175 [Bacillaceae bacterium]|nr:hypothetical protein [Bacillaceae bacterium]